MSDNFLDQSEIGATDPQWADIFKNMQGNILKPHGRNYVTMIFIRFQENNPTVARNVIGRFSQLYVTSFYVQMQERAYFKSSKNESGTFGAVFINSQGYAVLGEKPVLKDAASLQVIQARRALLKDHATNNSAGHQWDVHAMLMLADDNRTRMNLKEADVLEWLEGKATVLYIEYENDIRGNNSVEPGHNGGVENPCQPYCLAEEGGGYTTMPGLQWGAGWPMDGSASIPMKAPGSVLVHDPNVADGISFGSYFAFSRLNEQRRPFGVPQAALGMAC